MRKEVVSLSCLIQIKEGYSLLSKNEKKVADYILSHTLEVYDYSVQQLAESSGTSPSCIIRFVKKIGFESYTQFRLILAKESERQLMSSDELIEEVTKSDSIPEMLQKFKNFNINTINKTFENLDEVKIKKAVDILRKAKKIFVVGEGTSSLVAQDLSHKFILVGIDSCCHSDAHTQLTQVNDLTPEDAIVIFSYSGSTQLANFALKRANELNVPSVSVTQISKSYLARKATVPIYVPALETERKIGSVASRISTSIVSDILYLGTVQKNIDQIKEKVTETRKLLSQLKVDI